MSEVIHRPNNDGLTPIQYPNSKPSVRSLQAEVDELRKRDETIQADYTQEIQSLKNKDDEISAQLADTAKKSEVQSLVSNKAEKTEVAAVSNQVANIIAHNGDGTTPTELVDLRTGADGTVYTTAKQRADAEANKKLSKLELRNIIANGDFSNGTTGWSKLNGNISSSNNTLTFVADGTSNYPLVQQDTTAPFAPNHKIYACAKLKVTNLPPTNHLMMQIRRSSSGTYVTLGQINNPILNNEYTLSGIATTTDDAGGTIRLKFEFGAVQNGTTIEIKEVAMFDLTNIYGTGKEPSKDEFENFIKKHNTDKLFIKNSLYPDVFFGEVTKLSDDLNQKIDNKLDSITVTNIVPDSNLNNGSGWSYVLANGSTANNEITFTATSTLGQAKLQLVNSTIPGHKYYVSCKVKADNSNVKLQLHKTDGSRYLDISHSGNSNYETISGIATIDANTGLFVRVIDYRTSGWTPVIFKEIVCVNLTALFGAGSEPSKEAFESLIRKYNNGGLFFEKILKTLVTLAEPYNIPISENSSLPLYVTKNNDLINVVSKYSNSNDLCVSLKKKGGNNIFDFHQWSLISNTSKSTIASTAGNVMATNGTDMFAPYQVKAVKNINGDLPNSLHYTGGNHGYNNDATGTPTGRTTNITLFADGRKVDSFSGYCSYVDIYHTNMIQATNTKKADGSGREVIEENIHLHYDGYKWETNVVITILEDVDLLLYYGLQTINSAWNEGVFYHGGVNRKWSTWEAYSDSGSKKCNKMTLKKGNDFLELGIDSTVDIGDFSLDTASYSAFSKSYGKSYFNLVEGSKRFTAGDMLTYKGYYRFYSK